MLISTTQDTAGTDSKNISYTWKWLDSVKSCIKNLCSSIEIWSSGCVWQIGWKERQLWSYCPLILANEYKLFFCWYGGWVVQPSQEAKQNTRGYSAAFAGIAILSPAWICWVWLLRFYWWINEVLITLDGIKQREGEKQEERYVNVVFLRCEVLTAKIQSFGPERPTVLLVAVFKIISMIILLIPI